MNLSRRVLWLSVRQFVLFAFLLFGVAGTLDWPQAWILLGLTAIGSWLLIALVLSKNQELLRERMKSPIQKDQPFVDKILVIVLLALLILWIVSIPLDVFHLHVFPQPPPALAVAGLAIFAGGWIFISLTLRENSFAAPVIKLQEERGQHVIDTGVYRIVRHPMYLGLLLYCTGMSLWLGSVASLGLVALIGIDLMIRIRVEENFLVKKLAGYSEYRGRVRHRLIPFVW